MHPTTPGGRLFTLCAKNYVYTWKGFLDYDLYSDVLLTTDKPLNDLNQTTTEAEGRLEEPSHLRPDAGIEDAADDPEIYHPEYFHPVCVSSDVVDYTNGNKEMRLAIHLTPGTTKKEFSIHVGPLQ